MDDLNQLRGAFDAAVLTALADGKPDAEEYKMLGKLLHEHPILDRLGDLRPLLLENWHLLEKVGMEECLRRATVVVKDRDYRALAFKMSLTVMRADGEFQGEEAMVLGELQEAFQLSNDEVRALIKG
jgi:tellurite resistance protein